MKKIYFFILFSCLLLSTIIAQPTTKQILQIGDLAPNFKLKGVDGIKHTLPSMDSTNGVLVIFTCNSCPFSQAYEERIIALHKKYAPKGIPVVAINPNDPKRSEEDSYENMIARATLHQYPFLYLHDSKQSVAKLYGATRTPHVFLLNKSRKVIYIGAIDDNFEEPSAVKEKYLENAIDNYLNQVAIHPSQTKAIGCGIKWKK